jgi:hypothetical protein
MTAVLREHRDLAAERESTGRTAKGAVAGRLNVNATQVVALVRDLLRKQEVRLLPERRCRVRIHEQIERRHGIPDGILVDAVGAQHRRSTEEASTRPGSPTATCNPYSKKSMSPGLRSKFMTEAPVAISHRASVYGDTAEIRPRPPRGDRLKRVGSKSCVRARRSGGDGDESACRRVSGLRAVDCRRCGRGGRPAHNRTPARAGRSGTSRQETREGRTNLKASKVSSSGLVEKTP